VDHDDTAMGLSVSHSRTEIVPSIPGGRNEDLRLLTDDECLLCIPTMKGFDVQDKKWGKQTRLLARYS
jgi:hypothetical protein